MLLTETQKVRNNNGGVKGGRQEVEGRNEKGHAS